VGEKPTAEEVAAYEQDDGPLTDDQLAQLKQALELIKEEEPFKEEPFKEEPFKFVDGGEHPYDDLEYIEPEPEPIVEKTILEEHPYLNQGKDFWKKPEGWESVGPLVAQPEVVEVFTDNFEEDEHRVLEEPEVVEALEELEAVVDQPPVVIQPEIITEGVTKEKVIRGLDHTDNYILVDGRHMSVDAAKSLHPELFRIRPDHDVPKNMFGSKFPTEANKGDTFVRVDVLPNRVFKFDGARWIEVNKEMSDAYLHDQEYIKYLVSMIETGQYDVELLSDNEKLEIEQYLGAQK
jgi:hypothetical protein